MSGQSGFHIPCPCGKTVITPDRVSTCPYCGRELDLTSWGEDPALKKPAA